MNISSFDFRVIYYYLTCGKNLKYHEAINIMKRLGAQKKKGRYYLDLSAAAVYYYRKYKSVIEHRRIKTPIQLYYKAYEYYDKYNPDSLSEYYNGGLN
ncbi:hypothetical protein SAMN05660826_01766 [Caldanaerovirga acetigignens]|uniref:Uncharacterized protein n=1 Tax=Caldanaerovirga acetigignens TaxID=447595 RepID=A0A1M7L324_9FIRM|nr:hypothetical protein [Caldanaerovirga acetigignens]SHM72132.1 hypothetical protein SAMN05660826_01766 [Caldanaerovirga acetigignens]